MKIVNEDHKDRRKASYRDRIIFKAYSRVCLIALVGMVLSVAFFLTVLNQNIQARESDFRYHAMNQIATFSHQIELLQQFWEDIGSFYDHAHVSEEDFESFSSSVIKRTELSFVAGPAEERSDAGKEMIYVVSEPWVPVDFARKFIREEKTIQKTIARAQDRFAVSPVFNFPVEGLNDQRHIAVAVPVTTRPFMGLSSKQGHVISFLQLQPFFENAFPASLGTPYEKNLRIYLKDIGEEGDGTLIYEHQADENLPVSFEQFRDKSPVFSVTQTIPFGSKLIEVRIAPSFSYLASAANGGPWIALCLGVALTAFLAFWFFQQISQNLQVRIQVEEKTRALAETNNALEKTNRALGESNKALDDFVYIVSHDLKEPLRGINAYAQFLIEDYEDKLETEGKEQLLSLQKMSTRMSTLIDTLLEYSRLGRTELAFKMTDMRTVVEDTLELFEPAVRQGNVTITVDETMPSVMCDSARVGEIFSNLITNGLKYNDSEHKRIEIGYQNDHEKAPGQTVFFVRDNGIGIAPNKQDAVFQMFKRLHGREEYGGGTGSGLPIIKKIVERHNGRIWIESDGKNGSAFFFTLGN